MAAERAFRTYLIQQLKADEASAEAIILSGLDDFSSFEDYEEGNVHNLCTTIRKPGGAVIIEDERGAEREIPDPGVAISPTCEIRLQLAVYAAHYYKIVSRPVDALSMEWNRIKHFRSLKTIIKNHMDPLELPEISRKITIMKAIELVEEHLRGILGVENIPLAYVIRESVTPVISLAQNVLRPELPYGTAYSSFFDEMIGCASHDNVAYSEDNAAVMNTLVHVLKGTSFEVSLAPFKRKRDGRNAFFALSQHNLGTNRWEHILEKADEIVSHRVWNGRSNRYSLRTHVNNHREAQNNMLRAAENIPFEVPNEGTRVRKFLHSLQCSDQRVISAKTSILADPTMKNDFEKMANFLLIAVPSFKPQNENHRVSGMETFKPTSHNGSTGVELRFHTSEEYSKLTGAQKAELYNWRKRNPKRKGQSFNDGRRGDGHGTPKPPGEGTSKAAFKRRKISSLTSKISALEKKISGFNIDEEKKEELESSSNKNRSLIKPSVTFSK